MLGPRSDVAAIMQALDLLVINSSVEPFGLVALEAMACGTPVLATETGGLPEIIEHGKDGWLVPLRDENTLAAAMVSLARQPILRTQLASAGKGRVASQFSADRFVAELADFYCGLVGLKSKAMVGGPSSKPAEAAS
jgi:glycosyltransferase involved in cell wall biosynthesis